MNMQTNNLPLPVTLTERIAYQNNISDISKANSREMAKIISQIESESGVEFIRMEIGAPGLPTPKICIDAEIEALKMGVSNIYPNIEGIPELKYEISRFCKLFLNIDVPVECCLPTVGSIMGSFLSFFTLSKLDETKDTCLFIDPGFPPQKHIIKALGKKSDTFDIYHYRGSKLRDKLESHLKKGNIFSILYSNPNNPTWLCFTEEELQIIAELADKYNVFVIEDNAYFAMDSRENYTIPGKAPYQPTIAHYTDNYILLISGSKAFSYAGQRIAMMAISHKLFHTKFKNLLNYFNTDIFGLAMIFGAIYNTTAGTTHSAQYGFAALLRALNNGEFSMKSCVNEYSEKAAIMKKLFLNNGFKIVYDKDGDQDIADGFFFTISYPGLSGEALLNKLIHYGISCIPLSATGSERSEGLRACVSLIKRTQFPDLECRLKLFHKNNQKPSRPAKLNLPSKSRKYVYADKLQVNPCKKTRQ